jgi:cell surface protein SprA
MYLGKSESIRNPQYNPLDPDILLTTSLQNLNTKQERDSLKNIAQDYIKRNSINFTNVRKSKTIKKGEEQRKSRVYDLDNFTV